MDISFREKKFRITTGKFMVCLLERILWNVMILKKRDSEMGMACNGKDWKLHFSTDRQIFRVRCKKQK